jgi:hypothetical protein
MAGDWQIDAPWRNKEKIEKITGHLLGIKRKAK